ncbi:uncharacterized serine-rich protein C215.13 [Abrus precatorius]|uniref:Uncharacterized serine-rich protein C215.13 n=1 Tax=Abrus precatorius TaxID=3816 RepID=A0A8B8K1F9_ABRPR|nr:uncharacterized serine-rich protein C215.13 [Abrus precatorius]
MGCCISKCRPNKHTVEENHFNHVQDKLVISQAPPTPTLYSSTKISPSPPSPTSSTSSISSFTCTTSNTISSGSSLSTASSTLSSKDRSFSNEFLWSCYKDNPHITRINSLREATLSLMPPTKPKAQYRKINLNLNPSSPKPNFATVKQSPPQNFVGSFSMPRKRVRSNSPMNLTRQKSFRKEPERSIAINSASNMHSRTLESPSPSRRFNGDKCGSANLATTIADNSVPKRVMNSPKVSVSSVYSHSALSSLRKESVKPASPNNSLPRVQCGLRHRETCAFRVGSKIDETVAKDVLSDHDMDVIPMEDIDNPLISLDCFIFL